MNVWRWGWPLARRRKALSVLTAFAAGIPILVTCLMWMVDAHAIPTRTGSISAAMGNAQGTVRLLGSLDDASKVRRTSAALRELDPSADLMISRIGALKCQGRTLEMSLLGRDWTGTFAVTGHTTQGAVPTKPGEYAVTPGLAQSCGFRVGDVITVDGHQGRLVGLMTIPTAGRTSQEIFATVAIARGDGADFPSWTVNQIDRLTPERLQELHLELRTRDDFRDKHTALETHPVLLGGTILLSSVSFLVCARFLAGRTARRTRKAFEGFGATPGEVRRTEATASFYAALAGLLCGGVIVVVAWLFVPTMVADSHGLERPYPVPPAVGMGALTVASLLLPIFPALLTPRIVQRVRTARPHNPHRPAAVGTRLALAARTRTLGIATIAALVCGLSTFLNVFVAASIDYAKNNTITSGLRDGLVRLHIDDGRTPPPALLSDLEKAAHAPVTPSYEAFFHGDEVFGPLEGEYVCSTFTLIDDAAGWKDLAGRDLTTEERQALDAGQALGLDPRCPLKGQLRLGEDRPLGITVTLHRTDVQPRVWTQQALVMWTSTAKRLGLTPRIMALSTSPTVTVNDDLIAQMGRIVEAHGYSATRLFANNQPPTDPPLVVTFITVELGLLFLTLLVTMGMSIAADERPTHHLLSNLGMRWPSRWTIHMIVLGLPALLGAATGFLAGTVIAHVAALNLLATQAHIPSWALVPVASVLLIPGIAAATTPRRV